MQSRQEKVDFSASSCSARGSQLPPVSTCATTQPTARNALPPPLAAAIALTRDLSRGEQAIFRLLGVGYDNRSIAHELNLSEYTVKRHVTAILAKLQLSSRLQAGLTALIVSGPLKVSCWHLGGMDTPRSCYLSFACMVSPNAKEVTEMIIKSKKVSVARNSLPG